MASDFSFDFLRDSEHGGDAKQTEQIAQKLADFVGEAKQSLHIAIYDFRLNPPTANIVIPALKNAAERGVDVRIAYDHQIPEKNQPAEIVYFGTNDPKPRGTNEFLQAEFVKSKSKVQVKPIQSHKLMHSKYVLRDSETDSATVWMGSTNFTDDAWTFQENIIVTAESQTTAAFYEKDFAELWAQGTINKTGKNDGGSTVVDGLPVDVDFSPGDGTLIGKDIAGYISAAKERLLIASMVITSGVILGALSDAVAAHPGILSGVYDFTEMDTSAIHSKTPMKPEKIALFNDIVPYLGGKKSVAFDTNNPYGKHNYMHNKTVVADNIVVTGSFNFSESATENAENIVVIQDQATADKFAEYIKALIAVYPKGTPAQT